MIKKFKTIQELNSTAVAFIKEISTKAISKRGFCTLALSGGTTPQPLYKLLAREPYLSSINWKSLFIFLVDERFVPLSHSDSNYYMMNAALFSKVYHTQDMVHYIDTRIKDIQAAAHTYEKNIRHFFTTKHTPPQFDLIMLGIGEDGHTASLFPDTKALKEKKKLVVSVSSPSVKYERVTMTYPLINRAHNVVFIAQTKNKSHILKEVIENKNIHFPASRVNPINGDMYYFISDEWHSKGKK